MRVSSGPPASVRARRARRPVVGRVLRRGRVRHRPGRRSCSKESTSTRPASGSSTCSAAWVPTSTCVPAEERARGAGRGHRGQCGGRSSGTTITPDEGSIDEIPALAVAAAFADGVTEIRDAAELRVKESDRIGTLEQELVAAGRRRRGARRRAHDPRRPAAGGPARRATATTGWRWRPRSPQSHATGTRPCGDGRRSPARTRASPTTSPHSPTAPARERRPRRLPGRRDRRARGLGEVDGRAAASPPRLALRVLDTGAMYRAVTLAALERGVDLADSDAVTAVARVMPTSRWARTEATSCAWTVVT